MSCSNCCGNSSNTDVQVVVKGACCGLPEPVDGWEGAIDFVGELASADLTTGAPLVLHRMGDSAALPSITVAHQLYIFSYEVLVGVAGLFELFENASGSPTPPGGWGKIARGSLAQNGGLVHRSPNRFLRPGNIPHAIHSVAGQVDVVISGKIVPLSV